MLLLCLLTLATVFSNQSNGFLTINDDKIELILNSNVTKQDLIRIKTKLKEADIKIKFKNTKFYLFGGLQSLKFKVSTKTGDYVGSASHVLLTQDSKFGFFINRDPKAEISFKVGCLD